ncbi:DMT family transporter [Bacillus sp. 165]|uniref:EamA family transporter n=1 Tax=Bacillus sp. 165 TaxID=1529117 RepID=UPI001ADA0072|nr:EamA family transporter [Bacillus sp. 165]
MKQLRYLLLVLLGACSYGGLSTIIKIGFVEGFTIQELLGGQFLFGWGMLLLITLRFSKCKVSVKKWVLLMVVGCCISSTSILYGKAVEELPASIAVILLFQFTWVGILIEAVAEKQLPSKNKLLSIGVLFVGTLLAGGLLNGGERVITTAGIIYGLLAALSFAAYIFISGKIAIDVPPINRSFFMVTGAMILLYCIFSPSFLYNGALIHGLWKYGLLLGVLGIVVPVLCFSMGVPKVGSGLGTILGAAELPAAVIFSVVFLNEEVAVWQWVGIILILIGIVIPQLSFKKILSTV